MSLPAIYIDASWRCTQAFDAQRNRIGIGLNLPDGSVVRYALDLQSASDLAATLRKSLLQPGGTQL